MSPATAPSMFFHMPEGTMAFLENQQGGLAGAQEADFLRVFGANGTYSIPKQQKYWFLLNHVGDDSATTYLRIKITTFFAEGTPTPTSVYLDRIGGWNRPNQALKAPFVPVKLQESQADAFYGSNSQSDETKNDASLSGIMWNGIPNDSTDDSWQDREVWSGPYLNDPDNTKFFDNFESKASPKSAYIVNGLLMRFTPTSEVKSLSDRPLLFSCNGSSVIAIYISTYSPINPSYNHELWLIPN